MREKLHDISIRIGNETKHFTEARKAIAHLAENDEVTEACVLQATAKAPFAQRCVMMQIEYMRPATEEDTWAHVGDMIPVETLTCLDPTDATLHSFVHSLVDEYLKYAHHAPAWNRFWIGGAICSHDEHKQKKVLVQHVQPDDESTVRARVAQTEPHREVLSVERHDTTKWLAVLSPTKRDRPTIAQLQRQLASLRERKEHGCVYTNCAIHGKPVEQGGQ
jgi:hypothetical protein